MSNPIILTTGIYDLIKDHVRRRKVTPEEGELLTTQLKYAKQVRRRDLPEDVVSVNSRVTVKDTATGEEQELAFVPPGKGKLKHKTQSIMTPIGLALVGCAAGDIVKWPVKGEPKEFEILKVVKM
ncbi:MAG: GreA/GreB family elongation factor [Flavobacterium sp.]|nr:GreA/GreB family elongation factor [Flavobacterium sp.]